jgi:hypothetical protein
MQTLSDILLTPQKKEALFSECGQLLESQIANLSGLKGMALKTTVNMLKSAKPGVLDRAVSILIPEFLKILEPLHQKFTQSGDGDFSLFLQKHARETSSALLSVADARITNASSSAQSVYAKFRGTAEAQILEALPHLSKILNKHLNS